MTKKTLTPLPKTPVLTRKRKAQGIALGAAFLLAAVACTTEEDGDPNDPDTSTGGQLPPQPMPTGGNGTGGDVPPQPFPQGGDGGMGGGGGMGGDLLPPQPMPDEDSDIDLTPPQPFPDGDSD
jgi:hypothetical protein